MPINFGGPFNPFDGDANLLLGLVSQELSDGRIFLAYTDQQSATDVGFTVLDSDGTVLIPPTLVAPGITTANPNVMGAVATDGGGITIHFGADADGLFPLNATNYVASFDAAGNPVGGPTEVAGVDGLYNARNTVPEDIGNGNLAVMSDGGLTIFGPDGQIAGGATGTPGFSTTDNGYAIDVAANGTIWVATVDADFSFSFFNWAGTLSVQQFDASGNPLTPEIPIGEPDQFLGVNIGEQALVDIAVLTSGQIAVVWAPGDSPGDDDSTGLSVYILNADGTVASGPLQGNDATDGRQFAPRVFALDTGGFVVAYNSDDVTEDNESPFVRVQIFDANGNRVDDSEFPTVGLSITTGAQNSVILSDGTGIIMDEGGLATLVEVNAPQAPPEDVEGDGNSETITTGDGDDSIAGKGGNDTISSGGGNDNILGGIGFDFIQSGSGDDTVVGGDGFDSIIGGAGDDSITGNNGFDTLIGGSGNDTLKGGLGTDVLLGGTGDDSMTGDAGTDSLRGEDGNDQLFGNAGTDILEGGAGNDTLSGGINNDTLVGGEGADNLNGGNGSDDLVGGEGDDILRGNAGNDTINGGAGDDIMNGGLGADVFIYAEGADTIQGFGNNIDSIQLDAVVLGLQTLTEQQVVQQFATPGMDQVIFDFGGGNTLTVNGVSAPGQLIDDLLLF
ncbi:calcium-binding protein [uncultured Tateyamaria sp.]|uniref:calcium-binding protein n=1 Tax=uncultured Tateyamaria sp. TaxID=455651 RepID=UPI00261EF0DC|nr:calcium-binding protein [uncultured Tateyamaria sp.]